MHPAVHGERFGRFADLQVNGFLGTDMSNQDLSAEGFLSCFRGLSSHSACAFLMVHLHHNLLWAGIAHDRLTAMIITVGHQLPFSLVKTIFLAKGPGNLVMTSDASPFADLLPGTYREKNGDVVLEDTGLFHGIFISDWEREDLR